MWFAAHERVARASHFLSGIEASWRATRELQEVPTWELWLRDVDSHTGDPSRHFWGTEYSGLAILVFFMLGPLLIGLLVGGDEISRLTKGLVVSVGAVLVLAFSIAFKRRIARWKDWLNTKP
jgi:hypothetical protein